MKIKDLKKLIREAIKELMEISPALASKKQKIKSSNNLKNVKEQEVNSPKNMRRGGKVIRGKKNKGNSKLKLVPRRNKMQ